MVFKEAVDQESLFIQKDLSSHPISRESRYVKALAATSKAMVDPRKTSRKLLLHSGAAKLTTRPAAQLGFTTMEQLLAMSNSIS